jgi:hypothetical protein
MKEEEIVFNVASKKEDIKRKEIDYVSEESPQ